MSRVDDALVDALRFQRDAGATSPLYQRLLQVTLDDVDAGGPCAAVLATMDPGLEPVSDAVPLRFLGGLHRLVLAGAAPELARHYPSAGGRFEATDERLAADFLAAVDGHRRDLEAALRRGVQTNEVGRCAALLLGYLDVARRFGLPLRVREVGASAGLNLRWDHFRYEGGRNATAWGDPASPLRFADRYVPPLPDLAASIEVADRLGCDANPIDAGSDDGRLTLRSFVWPDQLERLSVLDAALAVAAAVPVVVERADAAVWVERELATLVEGQATVLVHSIVWQYLPAPTRRRIVEVLEAAGAAATASAPLAWLRMEPGADPAKSAEVRLQVWPGGPDRVIARSGYHGRPVRPVPVPA